MKVICDECRNEFENNICTSHCKLNNEDVLVNYIKCPECLKEFLICIDNKQTEELKKQINERKERAKKSRSVYLNQTLIRTIKKMQGELSELYDSLSVLYDKEKEISVNNGCRN